MFLKQTPNTDLLNPHKVKLIFLTKIVKKFVLWPIFMGLMLKCQPSKIDSTDSVLQRTSGLRKRRIF